MSIKIKTEIIETEVKHVEVSGKTFTAPTLKVVSYSMDESSYSIFNERGYKDQTSLTKSEFDEIKRLFPNIKVVSRWID